MSQTVAETRTSCLRLYATVRVARAVVLTATAVHDPLTAAAVSEVVSCLPLLANFEATLGGCRAIVYASTFGGTVLDMLERPMRPMLVLELLCSVIIFFLATNI